MFCGILRVDSTLADGWEALKTEIKKGKASIWFQASFSITGCLKTAKDMALASKKSIKILKINNQEANIPYTRANGLKGLKLERAKSSMKTAIATKGVSYKT